MKKAIKSLGIFFVIIATSLVFTSCGKSKSTTGTPASEISVTDEIENKSENTSNQEDEEENQIEIEGLFSYSRNLTFDDCSRENTTEVVKFFKTRDFNGVYDEAVKYGFHKFTSKTYSDENNTYDRYYYIQNQSIYEVLFTNGVYTLDKSSKLNVNDVIKTVEFDENTSSYNIEFIFYYKQGTKTILSPLTLKTQIDIIENSENINFTANYKYKADSAKLSLDTNENNILDESEYNDKLSEIFKIETSENVFENITDLLSTNKYAVSGNGKKLTIITESSLSKVSFDYSNLVSENYSIAGISYKLEDHSINLSTNKDEITLSVSIKNNTKLVFTIVAC